MGKVLFSGRWVPGKVAPRESHPSDTLEASEVAILQTVLRDVATRISGTLPGEFIIQAVTEVYLAGGLVLVEYEGLDAFGDPASYSTWRSFRGSGFPGFSALVITGDGKVILEEVYRVGERAWCWQLPGSYFRSDVPFEEQLQAFLEANHGVVFQAASRIQEIGRFRPLPDIQEHTILAYAVQDVSFEAPPQREWADLKAKGLRPVRNVSSFSLAEIDGLLHRGNLPFGLTEAVLRRAERTGLAGRLC